MIPFYTVAYVDSKQETPEQILARTMGEPPLKICSVAASETIAAFVARQDSPLVGLIFDKYFWYSHNCWRRWIGAILRDGAGAMINVPLGNQNPAWREALAVPLYLTVSGLEHASTFKAPTRWVVRRESRRENYCAVIVPISILNLMPATLSIGNLPEHWTQHQYEYRIFCEGWLHSFNADKNTGCRNDLLQMCEWHGMVLEIGCDTGLMAKTCKESGADVCWVGVDLNRRALEQAKSFVDLAICADVHSLPLSDNARFDRIVCGDVLEHLPYPWKALRMLRERVRHDGLLVASVPNVGHWTIVQDLLAGRWDEAPTGALCVSHLRFGTGRSWDRWFSQSGWQIIRWEYEKIPLPEHWGDTNFRTPHDVESLETIRYRLLAR